MSDIDLDELVERRGELAILDVRSEAEYAGAAGAPCDPRQGHIEGAAHLDWEDLFTDGQPRDAETIKELLAERGIAPDAEIVTYCHSGGRAAYATAALRGAGLNARTYHGSWHEWSRRGPEAA